MRFHELAKDLNADSKELLALAKKLGLPVKSHSSNLEPGTVGILKAAWKYRDLDEDAILEKLEQAGEQKEAEKKASEERAKQDSARATAEKLQRDALAKAAAEAAAQAVEAADGPMEAYVAPDDEVEGEEAEAEFADDGTDDGGGAVEAVEPVEGEVVTEAASPEAAAAPPEGPAAPAKRGHQAPAVAPAAHRAGEPARPGAVPSAPARRGAKIIGRIELNKADVAKSEATHTELERTLGPSATPGAVRGRKTELDREQELAAQRKRQKLAGTGKTGKWQTEADEFTPVSEAQVAKPKFWERGPMRRQQRTKLRRPPGMLKPAAGTKFEVQLPTSVKELSALLGLRAAEIISKLLTLKGNAIGISQALDEETVLTIAMEFNREVVIHAEKTTESKFLDKEQKKAAVMAGPKKEGEPRPPVVVVMGHVDHGKTSLLDAIRKTKIVDTEHGGITQHTRAYQVKSPKGGLITFLDTPGHRAFTEMRSRGANVTDIVVLVVSADDGVMPQTVESVEHARAANKDMPIVVALNKIDKREANPMRVKQQLMGIDLLPEEFGGKIGVVETSATTGKGIDELLERLALEAEVHDLRADPKGRAEGVVIEASKEEGKGVVATVLIRKGTLKQRDPFLCGSTWGRVRLIEDDTGRKVDSASPAMPVKVYGFKGDVPGAGDTFLAVEDEKGAEQVANERLRIARTGQQQVAERPKVTLENLFETLGAVKQQEIPLIIKADVQGSVEVLKRELENLKSAEVKVRVLRAAVGGITEEDVMLAATSKAMVFGFHVAPEGKARRLQEQLGVEVRTYFVIYEMLDDLKQAMTGLLKPEEKEKIIGHVQVRETFKVSKVGTIAGCFVTDGIIRRNDKVRVLRDGKVIYTSGLDSLRRFKDDAKEVKENFECGVKLANFDDVKVGDVLEVFEIVQTARELKLD
ncbi:MAG: translation initiation factor IF-2 [Planctomycetes bacterium]|nr:translation initiation factor IF-2 [Planctomycetota bacterium]